MFFYFFVANINSILNTWNINIINYIDIKGYSFYLKNIVELFYFYY